jgi:hypothetical protein
LLAASGRGDIRDIAGPVLKPPQARGMLGRLIQAMKGGF